MDRPKTTLFLMQSLDGKISTGDTNQMDVDTDFLRISGVKEGLQQYYDLEKQTDFFSLNTGKVWAKIGFNDKINTPIRIPNLTFILIDNEPHLNGVGIKYASQMCEKLILITTNENHPAFNLQDELTNIETIKYKSKINFEDMFLRLKTDFGANQLTIQSGGTLNAEFLRSGFIDYVSLVIAPVLIGGKDTPTLIDGESLHTEDELNKVRALRLEAINKLENSYIHLVYKVLN